MNTFPAGTTLEFFLRVNDPTADPFAFVDPDDLTYSGTTVTDLGTLDISLVSQPLATPTLTRISTGQYLVSFTGISETTENTIETIKVNGEIGGVAWSEFVVSILITCSSCGSSTSFFG